MDIPTLDKCPGYNLFIGGVIALRRPKALKNCNITHIVSVLDWKFEDDAPLTRGFQHLHIPVDDVEDENLLEWFPRSNAFIQQGLDYRPTKNPAPSGGVPVDGTDTEKSSGVLIHCAMGKSRSATVLLAYLLWSSRQHSEPGNVTQDKASSLAIRGESREPLSVVEALELLRRGRPIAEPNEGFMDQLHMYEAMGCPTTEIELKRHKIYKRWMNKRSVEESLRVNQAPEMAFISFEDEEDDDDDDDDEPEPNSGKSEAVRGKNMRTITPGIKAPDGTLPQNTSKVDSSQPNDSSTTPSTPQMAIKCRKCRHTLATTPFFISHVPPPHRDPSEKQYEPISDTAPKPDPQCAHIFLHPLSWMRPALAEGQMEGRLLCPNTKCGVNVGKFSWSGLRCSCGGWVTPGFGIIRGKVDEVTSRAGGAGRVGAGTGGGNNGSALNGVRLPPNMRKGNL